MVNNVILIGKIVNDITVVTLDSGKKISEITVAVVKNFKNFEGSYDTDYIKATLWEGLASNVYNYCSKGSLISIVGRLQIKQVHIEERKLNVIELVAESIGFLDSKAKSTQNSTATQSIQEDSSSQKE
jgi:single-strand DNA-binding protein